MHVQKLEIGTGTILRLLLILLAAWFLYVVRDILIMLIAAFIIASAIEPLARRLRIYGVPRAASVGIVYSAVIAVLIVILALMVPVLMQQVSALFQSVSEVLDRAYQYYLPAFSPAGASAASQLQEGLGSFGKNLANVGLDIFQRTRNVFSGIISLIFTFIIALYMVIEQDAVKKMFRFLVSSQHIAYVDRIIDRIQYKIGRWVLAQLALAVIIGIVVGVGLWAIGVQHALALGLLAGVLEIVPVIGPIIAGFVGVLVALSQSLVLGAITLVFYVVVQQVENHALIPNIMKKATGLNPLVTLIAVLLGARLAGTVGVILSIPVATMIAIFLSDFIRQSQSEDDK